MLINTLPGHKKEFPNIVFQDIEFPSVTVCNLNQVEASFLKDLNVYGNTTMTKLLFDEFINGHQRNLSKEEEEFIEKVFSNVSDYNSVKVVYSSWLKNKEQKNQCKIRTNNLVQQDLIVHGLIGH